MNNKFEIIDNQGVIESGLNSFDEALDRLTELDNDPEFQQIGDLKIIEVHYIRV